MELINRAYAQLHELYRSASGGSRLAVGLLAAVALLGLGYLCAQQGSAPCVDLMRGVPITAAQMPAMVAAFAKAKLKVWEICGTSIRVPRGQESAYMLALADANALPKDFGSAQRDAVNADTIVNSGSRDQRLKIAKQDDLAQAIGLMPGIERAYVLYDVDPRPGGFKEKLITATVCVKPIGTAQLDEARVSSIRQLVAGAIAGLKPENVTVSDLGGAKQIIAQEIPSQEKPAASLIPEAFGLSMQSSTMLLCAGSIVIGLLAVGLILRRGLAAGAAGTGGDRAATAQADVSPQQRRHDSAAEPFGEKEDRSALAANFAERLSAKLGTMPANKELSQLVEDDPDAAANVLRNWIGQAG
jgi:flagellar biosynthesis/type III secretory pathway M-ring protein FliF/YscJ